MCSNIHIYQYLPKRNPICEQNFNLEHKLDYIYDDKKKLVYIYLSRKIVILVKFIGYDGY